jgi:hypothetical protein
LKKKRKEKKRGKIEKERKLIGEEVRSYWVVRCGCLSKETMEKKCWRKRTNSEISSATIVQHSPSTPSHLDLIIHVGKHSSHSFSIASIIY